MRAILIDDEVPALELLDKLLTDAGVEIVGAYTDARKAIKKLEAEKIDVVFLDIEMPGMNGLEAAETILSVDSGVDIVFVTAYNQYAIQAFDLSAIDYVMKPASVDRLMKTIERISVRKGVRDSGQEQGDKLGAVCFGRFELIAGNSAAVKWRLTKERELMAYLVHHRNTFVSRDKILEDLWGHSNMEQAKSFLHTCIYNIRKKLNLFGYKHNLVYTESGYRFEMAGMWCDAAELEQITGPEPPLTPANIGQFEQKLQLYKGDYMEEDGYVWAAVEQEKFKRAYMATLMRMAEFYISAKKYSLALSSLKRLLQKNPFHDSVNEALLNVYALMGDRKSMVEHYESFTSLLKDELGILPVESTVKLYAQLCNGIIVDPSQT